ncbi:MAG: hypothetical protein LBU58_10310 [Clostridiales bacterium]|nr:hypothetical protein [Clostridiales bacterium]
MKVYGFVGPSGTGKSHRALEVAQRNRVPCILDDGLLIRDNLVLAGTSAKREPSRLASVRRALFLEQRHADAVRDALLASGTDSVLILGTSVNMVDAIAKRLSLPAITKYIDISDIASERDIEAARTVRKTEGKHVIPVPTFALKKEFSGYFLDPLRRLARRGKRPSSGAIETIEAGERTVVRPTFSYLGGYTISRAALEQLASRISEKAPGVARASEIRVDFSDEGLALELSLSMRYGCRIHEALKETAARLRAEFDRQTALHVREIALTAKSLASP